MTVREGFRERRRRRRRRGRGDRRAIYLLPNVITSASLLLGFWSIVMSIQHDFQYAALFIVLAGICDVLDGRVARATHSTSRFGVEYDSISDMVSFGMAPALLIYSWILAPLGSRAWLIAALFALCAALRLARFNVTAESGKSDHYHGVPSTAAGGIVASSVWFVEWLGYSAPFPKPLGLTITIGFAGLALLMVSPVPYPSWSSIRLTRRHAYPTLVASVLGLVAVLLHHEAMLFAVAMTFLVSGPVFWLIRRRAPDRSEIVDAEAELESSPDVE